MARIDSDQLERDEQVGQAIEDYLSLAESGHAPDPEEYLTRFPDLSDDLREALDGLALVKGLVGQPHGEVLEAGRRVAGYRIVRELGRGGMGVVYDAVHVDLDRPVALKVLGHNAAPDSSSRRRFLNEAKTAASLHHTHIVPVFDVGQVGGLCYYAMQRIEGCGLDRVVKALRRSRSTVAGSTTSARAHTQASRGTTTPEAPAEDPSTAGLLSETGSWAGSKGGGGGRLSPRREDPPRFDPPRGQAFYRWVAQVGRQAADALGSAHRRGIIHRDVKPSNLLVDLRGSAWVADFGLARRAEDPGLTHSGIPLGTPRYMSPEQALGSTIDARTDQYSLGATLYELLTLRPPFEGSTTAELIQQITNKEPLAPRRADSRVPRDLETIVLKAMSKRTADRYDSAEDLAADLERFLALEPVKARRIGPVRRFVRFAQRNPFATAVSTLAASVVLAIATWAHMSVLDQRNTAFKAEAETRKALDATQVAVRKSEAALGQQLWREASLIRVSPIPNRRKQGLERLRESASLDPNPAMRVRLRDEALEFLALRDVEELPPIAAGRAWGHAFSRDGRWLAVLTDDGFDLAIHDTQAASPARRVALRTGAVDSLPVVAPERFPRWRGGDRVGRGVVPVGVALAVIWPNGRGVRLLDPETGARYADLAMPDREIIALFSVPGGRRLITMERINTASSEPGRRTPARAVLWDLERPESPLATVAEPDADGLDRPPGRGGIPLVAVSSEGRTIATTFPSAGSPETGSVISLWDADTGIERRRISDIRGTITALALGPEALVAAAINDGTIRLWEGRNLTQLPGLYHHQMMVTNLRFSPEGSLLAVAGTGSGVELWDPATNVQMAAVRTPERAVDVGFSPDGETLAATCGETVSLWAIVDPVGRSRLPGSESWPTDLSFDANGRLAVTSLDEEPRIWSPGDCPSKARSIAGVRSSSLTFDEQGRLITVDTEGMRLVDVSVPDSWPIELVPFRGRESESRRANSAPGIPFGSSFARGGSSFVTAGALGSMGGVPIIDTAIEYVRRAQSRMRPWLLPLGASSDRRTVAVARRDDVFLWRSEQPEALQRVVLPSVRRAGSDRDRRAGSTGSGGPGPFWTNVLVSPGGERLYLQSLESGVGLQAWRLEDRSGALHAIPLGWSGQIQRIVAVDLSSDGGTLAVVTARGGVRLIDAVTGELRLFVPSTDLDPDDHATSVAFSPDGKRLAVGLQRGRIALYSLTRSGDAELLAHFPGHIGAVRMLGFDPSGRLLASGGEDKVVQTWDLEEVRGELASLGLDW